MFVQRIQNHWRLVEGFPALGRKLEIRLCTWTRGNHSIDIQLGVTCEVVSLDVLHKDCLTNFSIVDLVQVSAVLTDMRVIANAAYVAFKINHINLIKAAQCHKQT